MGVCIKLATRSLRKNKGRTLITLMGIVLSVLMVCTIFTLLNSMLDSAIDSIIEKDGNWHIAVYNTTAEQIADLEAAEGVLSTQMISIDENDVFRITLKNPGEVYEFASRYLSETTEYSYHTELLYEHSELTEATLYDRAFVLPESVEDAVLRNMRYEALHNAINKLPETQRRRLILYYFNGLTYSQIAEMEGCKYQTVQDSIYAALNNLKKILK